MKWISILVLALTFSSTAGAAANGKRQATVDKRQQMQQQRINHGIKNGSLTSAEQQRLKRQQAHVMKTEKRAAADGQITKRENRRIEKQQNRANRNIYRHKHN